MPFSGGVKNQQSDSYKSTKTDYIINDPSQNLWLIFPFGPIGLKDFFKGDIKHLRPPITDQEGLVFVGEPRHWGVPLDSMMMGHFLNGPFLKVFQSH